MSHHHTDRCSYCGQPGHLAKDCRWPKWHARRDDGGSWGPLWLRVLAYAYLPYGCWLILQQIAKMRGAS